MDEISVPLTIVISREGEWYVASCPLLNIGTQGKTEQEVRENMTELIDDYLKDPDTPKPLVKTLLDSTVTIINIPVRMEAHNGKAQALTP